MKINIPDNIKNIILQHSKRVQNIKSEDFYMDCTSAIYDGGLSPIEQVLLSALKCVIQCENIPMIGSSEGCCTLSKDYLNKIISTSCISEIKELCNAYIKSNRIEFFTGIDINIQYKIKNYRVDFYLSYSPEWFINGHCPDEMVSLIVECDSQEFHERTEAERRYEKKRDRDLGRLGYVVFHYTGKEILQDSIKVATDIIAHLRKENPDELYNKITNIIY